MKNYKKSFTRLKKSFWVRNHKIPLVAFPGRQALAHRCTVSNDNGTLHRPTNHTKKNIERIRRALGSVTASALPLSLSTQRPWHSLTRRSETPPMGLGIDPHPMQRKTPQRRCPRPWGVFSQLDESQKMGAWPPRLNPINSLEVTSHFLALILLATFHEKLRKTTNNKQPFPYRC